MYWQEITVGVVIALAAFYVGRIIWRGYRGKNAGCGCGDSRGCPGEGASAQGACQGCSQEAQCVRLLESPEKQ